MPGRIRIRCADAHRNITYITRGEDHRVRCILSNGVLASFFYAGILSDEVAARFALEDCRTPEAALEVVRRLGSRTFQYSLVEEPPACPEQTVPAPACVYLRLFHGRRDPEADLEERGSEGPVIGPLAFVHVTYLCDVKFAASSQVMERFFPDVISDWRSRGLANAKAPLCDWHLDVAADLILYDGVYYGDWSVTARAPDDPGPHQAKKRPPGGGPEVLGEDA
ncbi:hypothetical protein HZF05_11095 [Sphingomonas sp. CGMCC 1.13654]|uniref:Uncharacterized protein n=1 Tax=Sphingomonas chungangi TaxID=2683589 RepID=A0A838L5K5_9SPHN|nr:hypothetical protein [Sphingomonas chungangi]MBA2934641.1 hypothetical protein [Sphingomonas chungangi]MVW57676.1 hypothetical protein [Sphingomonas chungangi]